ncbi:fumarylacetoacetate hydrolase family protein [Corynebacterium mayonis]|uniref:fumarylacetoacetate hydrolase family protein n=1 Tax=Corynebacterium mayonis TaxID=3062461 RepID=UPI00314026CE
MTNPAQLPVEPGKVIAVHVAFESRAAQRGRRPKAPSYFLKAASSLAPSGDIERPAGCDLLAFEGEIALIIGRKARRVTLEDAWSYVGWVTASNDFGIYDYKPQDKGSNTRSKSRDGYTPIGPNYIEAAQIDPAGLRLRTWVNGEIAQEDTSSPENMIFPLAQFVADLSQHMTLEPGDIILSGTPQGSTVVTDGDVVEVEVDHPATGATSGKLTTRVVEGPGNFDASLGLLPTTNDTLREDAYGSRNQAGLPASPYAISAQLRAKLMEAPTAGLSAELRSRGLNQVVIEGVYPQTPGTKMVGPARTLRFLPEREDLFATHGGGFNAQKRTFDAVEEGEVIVIEARQQSESGTLGDILALRALNRGAAGVVTDGKVRDYAAVKEIGLPVFTQGAHPAVLGRRHVPWDFDLAIACGNVAIVPGDIIVGDDDGVVVIPREMAEEVVDAALAKEREDEWVAEQVKNGHKLDGMFPPTGEMRQAYEKYAAEHGKQ